MLVVLALEHNWRKSTQVYFCLEILLEIHTPYFGLLQNQHKQVVAVQYHQIGSCELPFSVSHYETNFSFERIDFELMKGLVDTASKSDTIYCEAF